MISLLTVVGVIACAALAGWLTPRFTPLAKPWLGALVAAVVSVWALITITQPLALPAFAALAVAWGAATAIDIAIHDLPDKLTLLPFPIFLALLMPWAATNDGWDVLIAALVAGLGTALVLFVLAFISPNSFGLGDVKLGLTTGAALGCLGPGAALLGIPAAFITFAVFILVLMGARRIGRKAEVAFGPFMVVGVLVAPLGAAALGW